MATRQPKPRPQPVRDAAHIFIACDGINQLLIDHLNAALWTAKPPGNVRTIAAIFTHIHNVRCKWIRLSAPQLKPPPQLSRATCTPQQATAALASSAALCAKLFEDNIKHFHRDALAKPWLPGQEMLCYMLTHEAHHRGQVCMLAHQLGSPLPGKITSEMWNWEKLWKASGLSLTV